MEISFDHPPAETTATITLPGGQQRRVAVVQSGQRWTMRFTETAQPGRYLLSFAGSSSSYVVSAPRDESDPTPLAVDRWSWLETALKFRRVDAEKNALARVVTAQRTGKELHLALVGCVALLALAEMTLSRLWSKM